MTKIADRLVIISIRYAMRCYVSVHVRLLASSHFMVLTKLMDCWNCQVDYTQAHTAMAQAYG